MAIIIRPISAEDIPMMMQWLNDPEVYQFWEGVPATTEQVQELCRYYEDEEEIVPRYIIEVPSAKANTIPIGFAQTWESKRTRERSGIDLVLLPSWRFRGYGREVLRELASQLLQSGNAEVTVDPLLTNVNAITAFEKAGFHDTGERYEDHEGMHLIMRLEERNR